MRAKFFASLNLRDAIRATGKWLKQLSRIMSRRHRFIALSPPLFSRQFIYDKKRDHIFSIWIRNITDYNVLRHCFFDCAFDLQFLKAHGIEAFYNAALARGNKPLIIDCGANSGMASRFFAQTYPEAEILGIEPDSDNVAQAKKNNASSVNFMTAAIGSEMGKVEIVNPAEENWAYQTRTTDSISGIPVVTVTDLLERQKQETPFIIKIDIEGFESNLFQDNLNWIERFPVIIIELHDWMLPSQANSQNFLKAISKHQRDFLWRGENAFSLDTKLAGATESP